MGFLDALAPYLDTAASGLNAYDAGQQEHAAKVQADALAEIERRAKAAEAARRARLDDLTERNTLSLIRERERPAPVAPRNIDPLSSEGRAATLELERERARLRPAGSGPAGSFTQFTGPDGTPVFFNPQTRESVSAPTGFAPPSPRSGAPTEAERKAKGLLLTGEQGYKTLESLLTIQDDPNTPEDESGYKSAPGFWNRQLSRVGMGVGNILSPDEMRQQDQAAYDLSEAWLRLTSGAAIGRDEIDRSARAIIPQPGDDPATLKQKAASRRLRVEALRQAAGRANDPNAVGTAPNGADDLDARINAVLFSGRQP